MKKKGLIIATIVMVLVLAVSLTTATYAWFSTQASTKVDTISVTVDAASAVAIGVTTSYGSTTEAQYLSDSVNVAGSNNTLSYTDGTEGLGTTLGFSSAFALSTAVATTASTTPFGTAYNAETNKIAVDNNFTPHNTIFKADPISGTANTSKGVPDPETASAAASNVDYIDLSMGCRAAQSGVQGIYCTVTVKTTDTSQYMKMNAALHFYIGLGAYNSSTHTYAKSVEFDLFGGTGANSSGAITYNTQKANVTSAAVATQTGVTYAYANNQVTATFSFFIYGSTSYNANNATLPTSGEIYPFRIYGYIFGEDTDCVTSGTGCGCTIDMEFSAINSDNTSGATSYILNINA